MLDRIRIEVMSPDKEKAEDELAEVQAVVFAHARKTQPDLVLECTDEHFPPVSRNGQAFINGRRVFRLYENMDAFHEAYDGD